MCLLNSVRVWALIPLSASGWVRGAGVSLGGGNRTAEPENENTTNSVNKFLTLLAALLVSASAFAGEFPDISISEVKALAKSKKATIIDVNGTESFNKGHVPGAVNFDVVSGKLADALPKDKNALIVAYCGSPKCKAYQAAATAAEKLGYKNVKHMSAGISGWLQAGEKTESAK